MSSDFSYGCSFYFHFFGDAKDLDVRSSDFQVWIDFSICGLLLLIFVDGCLAFDQTGLKLVEPIWFPV
jgi:hypothetical protein